MEEKDKEIKIKKTEFFEILGKILNNLLLEKRYFIKKISKFITNQEIKYGLEYYTPNLNTNDFDLIFYSLGRKQLAIKEEDNLSESKWNEIDELTGIKNNLALKLVRSNYDNGMVTLRYKNIFNDNGDILLSTSSFRESLTKKGFTEDSISLTKLVYKKDNKTVIIMKDFEYIVIMMVI